ncbi:MAG: DEAD/DEAH box helicase family protein, partial [Bacillota bacterium]
MLEKLDQSIRKLNERIDNSIHSVHQSAKSHYNRIIQLIKHHQQVSAPISENSEKRALPSSQSAKVLLNKGPVNQIEDRSDDAYLLLDGLFVTKERLQALKKELPAWKQFIDVHPVPAMTKTYVFKRCERCLNEDSALFLPFPCGKCGKTDWYCLNCLKYGRLASCQTLFHLTTRMKQTTSQATGFRFTSTLTPHQQQASNRLTTAIKTSEPHLLIHAVCGAGKTEMLFHGINHALTTGKRVCVATPRQDVIKELFPRFQAVFTQVPMICQYGGSEDNHKQAWLTLCTTHQLIRYKAAFDVLIIDEVDAFPYHNDVSLIKQSERALKDTGTFIYLSATPRPSLVKKRYPTCFVPVRYHGHPLPVPVPYFTHLK